ncbi:MAG: aminotransferase class V-fold PLP-dependent enzyme [Actinomycetota bacterium]|nr:aminotransferase class V-fold PLP-dependent enzyme [Actinomycetota bacterium]
MAHELERYRTEFPIVDRRTYLISASLGPLSVRSRAAAEEHLDLWQRLGPEELWLDHGLPKLDECRGVLAGILGASRNEMALVPSVSAGLSSIATCLDLKERPKIVLSAMDFPTNHYVWRAQERRGAELDVVPTPDGIRVDPEEYVARIDDRTAIVNVNRVLFESSWIVDLEPIVAAAHDHGALVVVDDFHGTGIVPVDVRSTGIDLLLGGVLKWLCGGQGLAFMYCRADLAPTLEPLVVGWFGTVDPFSFDRSGLNLSPDAGRFEAGTYPLPLAWTAAGGLSLISEVGVQAVRGRNQQLTGRIIEHVDEAGLELLTPREPERRGGLVRVRIPGGVDACEKILHALFDRDVVVDRRGDALRMSPHFFNNEDEIDRCFSELSDLL